MKLFLKVLLFAAVAAAALVGLSLLDDEKNNRYISVYDTEENDPY